MIRRNRLSFYRWCSKLLDWCDGIVQQQWPSATEVGLGPVAVNPLDGRITVTSDFHHALDILVGDVVGINEDAV